MLKLFKTLSICCFLIIYFLNSSTHRARATTKVNPPVASQLRINNIIKAYEEFCFRKLFIEADPNDKYFSDLKKDILEYCRLKEIYLTAEKLGAAKAEEMLFKKYFNTEIKPRLINDYKRRVALIHKASKLNLAVSPRLISEKLSDYDDIFYGRENFLQALNEYEIDINDLLVYIKSDLVSEAVAERLFEERYKSNPEFQKKVDAKLKEEYLNLKKNQISTATNYYFRQFYIDKNSETAKEKITYLRKILLREPNYRVAKDLFKDLVVFDMVIPVNSLGDFYAKNISDGVMRLRKPLQITNVISSEYGYHILQLKKIESDSQKSFNDLYPQLFTNVKTRYLSLIQDELL